MAKWNYILRSGIQLHEAIEADDIETTVKCLIACSRELLDKLNDEDREWKQYDIEDAIDILEHTEMYDEDEVNEYLDSFYDLCDELGAWIAI